MTLRVAYDPSTDPVAIAVAQQRAAGAAHLRRVARARRCPRCDRASALVRVVVNGRAQKRCRFNCEEAPAAPGTRHLAELLGRPPEQIRRAVKHAAAVTRQPKTDFRSD